MSGEPAEVLVPRLTALVRREILTLESDPRAPTRGQHAFVQALIREVAFSTLSKRERRARHLTAARYFESIGDDEMAGVVATHFVEAYRAAPEGPEGEAVATQARISLLATAERANDLGAIVQAIDALKSALEVTPDPAQRARLLERIGVLQTFHSEWDAGFANLASAIDAYTNLGDRIGVLRATGVLMNEQMNAGRITEAEKLTADIEPELEALVAGALEQRADPDREDHRTAALLAETRARLDFRRQEYADSVRWADRAVALAEPLRLDEEIANALVTKGTSMGLSGQLRQGSALLEGAAVDATAHRQNLAALRALNNLASFTAGIDPRASLERTKLGFATARRLGLRSFDTYHSGNAVGAADSIGEWAWVRGATTAMLEGDRDPNDIEWLEHCRDFFDVWTGTPNVARVEHLLATARKDAELQGVRNLSSVLARFAFAAGDAARAVALVEPFLDDPFLASSWDFEYFGRFAVRAGRPDIGRRILELAGRGPGGVVDHHLEVLRAGLATMEGRRDDAVGLYRAGLAGYRAFGLRFSLALTVVDMARLLGGADPAVKSVIDEARGTLDDLGAAALRSELDALAAAPRQPIRAASASLGASRS